MASTNDVTGDEIKTKGGSNDAYRSGWDAIFAKKAVTSAEAASLAEKALHHDPRAPYCPHCGVYELTLANPHKLDCPKSDPLWHTRH